MSNLLKLILIVCLVILVVSLGPWLVIWAINTLVAAGGITTFVIPFTFWTWLAALLLGVFLRGSHK